LRVLKYLLVMIRMLDPGYQEKNFTVYHFDLNKYFCFICFLVFRFLRKVSLVFRLGPQQNIFDPSSQLF